METNEMRKCKEFSLHDEHLLNALKEARVQELNFYSEMLSNMQDVNTKLYEIQGELLKCKKQQSEQDIQNQLEHEKFRHSAWSRVVFLVFFCPLAFLMIARLIAASI